jgi:hypothetical protein
MLSSLLGQALLLAVGFSFAPWTWRKVSTCFVQLVQR